MSLVREVRSTTFGMPKEKALKIPTRVLLRLCTSRGREQLTECESRWRGSAEGEKRRDWGSQSVG